MQIDFEVEGQRLILTSESYIVADSLNFIKIKAVFSSDWDCLTKFAVFNRDSNTYEILLDAENSCIIPCECVDTEGEFYLSFIGINDEGKLVVGTTKEKTLVVKENGVSDHIGSEEQRLTLTYLGEVLARVKEAVTAAEDAKGYKEAAGTSANNAKVSEGNAFKAAEAATKSAGEASDGAKAAAESAKGIGDAEEKAKGYAEEAKKQADSAGVSAKSAGDSATKAVESALSSGHAAGAAGEAANAAASAAQASFGNAESAALSASAAAASAQGIGEAEGRAAASAKSAEDSAAAAANSAKAAAGSESKVNADKLAAERAAQEAKTSETSAEKAATEAASSKVAADGSASAALQAKTAAESAKTAASNSANEAESFKTAAVICANNARASETAAGVSAAAAKDAETNSAKSAVLADTSATTAAAAVNSVEAAKSAAATSAANAKASESNAANSATAADTSANNASVSAAAAVESKIAAAESENNANTFKNLAQESATTAAGSASTATSEANRAKAEADRAVEAAEQAAAGGVRKVNGISPDAEGNVNVPEYEHPSSGVTAGTYRSVTVNAQGHIIGGSNPNTLAGYGITDAKITGGVITLGGDTITPLTAGSAIDASKLTGVVKIENLPPTVIERIKTVEDDAARFALTTAIVQNGDSVKVVATNLMYYVKDDTKLGSEDGYEVYTAGAAASVPWSGVTDLPATFAPSAHNHKGSEITLTGYIKAETATEIKDTDNLNVAVGKLEKMIEGKQATGDYALSDHSHDVMIGAGASATGTAGFVPAPAAGKQDSFLKGDGTWQYPPNNKVTQTVVSDNAEYPLLLAIRANQTANTTDEVCFAISAKFNPATKTLTLDKFKGALIGNADSSTKAEQDSDGNNIITTYSTKTELAEKANKATTLAGYGITDAKILNGEISLGGNKIKPLTQHQDLSGYAPLDSPEFTTVPTTPTAEAGNNTKQIASTAFVQQELKNYVKTTTENTFSNKNTFEKTITTISDFQTYEEVTDDKTLTADSANWQIVTLTKDITLTIDNSNMVPGKIKVYQVQVTTGIVVGSGYRLNISSGGDLISSPIFYPNGEVPVLNENQGLLLTITVTSDLMHGIFCYVGTVCDGLEG